MNQLNENPEYGKILVDSAVEQFTPDIKVINFVLDRVQRIHKGCDFMLNGGLVLNHAYEMVKNIPTNELHEDQGISIFYLMASYLHKRHFNFMSTIRSPNLDEAAELTHVSTKWNEELDARMLTKPDVANEIIQTMEDYADCNSEQRIVDNLGFWKDIMAKSKVMLENDIFIISKEE